MALLSADTFNRADNSSAVGSTDGAGSKDPLTWTTQAGTCGISSNQTYVQGGALGLATVDLAVADIDITLTFATIATGAESTSLVFRFLNNTSGGNYWEFLCAGGSTLLQKRVNGTVTQFGSSLAGAANGDVMRVVAIGSSIWTFRNGTLVAQATDSFSATSTKHGFASNQITTPRFDSWSAYDASAIVGAQAAETDAAQAGSVYFAVFGSQASETDTGIASTGSSDVIGHQAVEIDTAIAGSVLGIKGIHGIDVQFAWDDDALVDTPLWFSATPDPQDIQIVRGKPYDADDYTVGTGNVTLDEINGTYNQLNASGPHYGKLTPYRQMRVVAYDSTGMQYTMFRGHVNPRGWVNQPQLPGPGTTVAQASDPLALCAQCDLSTQVAAGTGDTTKDRLTAVMALAGFPGGSGFWQWLSTTSEVGATLGDTIYGGKLLQYLQLMALSDGGALWCTQNGVVTLEHRLYTFLAARRTTTQATFADDGSGIPFETITPNYAHDIVNTARMAGVTGTVQTVTDGTSISTLTGIANTVEHLDLLTRDDPDALARAELLVQEYKDFWYGPVTLTFEVTESDTALDAALHLDVRDRVQVKYTPPGLAQVTTDHFVERISHNIPIQANPNVWKCTLELSPAARYTGIVGTDFLQWDVGKWDEKKWSY